MYWDPAAETMSRSDLAPLQLECLRDRVRYARVPLFTALTNEALPVIRYRTDDIGSLRALQTHVEREIRDVLGIQTSVKLVEPNRIERTTSRCG